VTPLAAEAVLEALKDFARNVTGKFKVQVAGDPEDQLRAPFEVFLKEAGAAMGITAVLKGESQAERIGRPDFGIAVKGLLVGYVELKAPGKGADPRYFKGHDKQQWERFQLLPNIIYTDGNQWALFQRGSLVDNRVTLHGDVTKSGVRAVKDDDAARIEDILWKFFSWRPIVPESVSQLARQLAPLCRLLRNEVREQLGDSDSVLSRLAGEWRDLLFPGANDDQFADEYAQTVTYALLLARAEKTSTLEIHAAAASLRPRYTLLARALEVLTDDQIRKEIPVPLDMLQRVVNEVKPEVLAEKTADPWLYFYEEFLAVYDPKLRKDMGVYYTPVPVVRTQVRLVDEILREKLDKRYGFADKGVTTLDPAVGTGTYLLGIIEHTLEKIGKPPKEGGLGPGAVPARATELAGNLYGFELMAGPYAVAELRIAQQLEAYKATLPPDAPNVYLTDTLESPHTIPPAPKLFYDDIAREHEKALKVKDAVPVLVCIGNPPYDRHPAGGSRARTGGWVRHGDEGDPTSVPILESFLKPVRDAGKGGQLKNIYNLYVYFWRWALWKVFEHNTPDCPGIVTYISAASYLDGDAFAGMREQLRRMCDDVWIIDLGGENRGPRKSENVFNIQTPVAIAIAVRYGESASTKPAQVRYARIDGSRDEKYVALEAINSFSDLKWKKCPTGWADRLRPAGKGDFFKWPEVIDVFPWQHSGVKVNRSWPISPDEKVLRKRWAALLKATDQATAFFEAQERSVSRTVKALITEEVLHPIKGLPEDTPMPDLWRYGFRTLDRQWLVADNRLISRPGPPLWQAYSNEQIHLTSLLTTAPLGNGPALTATAYLPDLHHFRGSFGAKDCIPLWRDSHATKPNITPRLLNELTAAYGEEVTPADLLAYCYGVLSLPLYTEAFATELESSGPRVPVTRDTDLYHQARDLGKKLIWLHTYGERLVPKGMKVGTVPPGQASCVQGISDDPEHYPEKFTYVSKVKTLVVGDGEISPVSQDVWDFEVSGLKILNSWLSYRMKNPSGKKSSPLDSIGSERWTSSMTEELLTLIWILEHTVEINKQQAAVFEKVIAGPLFEARDLPQPRSEDRQPPTADEVPGKSKPSLKDALHPEAMFEDGLLSAEAEHEYGADDS
jgi:hypothetical protein